jgi:hypothetical protein
MKVKLLLILSAIPVMVAAQSWKQKPFSVSVFNNASMMPPASLLATFNQPLHPGVEASYEFGWKQSSDVKLFQNASIGYFYQRYLYQAILLYSRAGYRRNFGNFSTEGSLQAGYMHALLLTDRAVFQSDGSYKAKKGIGKPQFIAGAGLGFGYDLGYERQQRRIFLNYDFRIQMPFVKSYVPLLPNGILSAGFQFTLNQ